MVRHWILIPAFPGSNPGSAVLVKRHFMCLFFVYRKENCVLIKKKHSAKIRMLILWFYIEKRFREYMEYSFVLKLLFQKYISWKIKIFFILTVDKTCYCCYYNNIVLKQKLYIVISTKIEGGAIWFIRLPWIRL